MPAQPEAAKAKVRTIAVRLHLEGGQRIDVSLDEDAPELGALFRILASRGNPDLQPAEMFLQLPMDNGRSCCSFNSRQLVSVVTEPPVLVQLDTPAAGGAAPSPRAADSASPVSRSVAAPSTPRVMLIDDFLSPDEHQAMLDFAQAHEPEFESGTVEGRASPHRQNRVIMGFANTPQSRLLQNRLLTWLPYIVRDLGLKPFPVGMVESQLTASNDGHYYRVHADAGTQAAEFRTLTCVYYFFRQPRGFGGGGLRLYDSRLEGNIIQPASSYREFEPVANRLLVFPSTAFHELMHIRCPSRQFADSRFAVTSWVHGRNTPDPEARFGWSHLHCGVVPGVFEG